MSNDFIPFALPDITKAEIDEVVAALESGWITTGPRVKQLEKSFAERLGAGHAVAVNSCTAAMHLALEAIGIGPGDEVIIPTFTFAATGEVVRYMQATPVLVDVCPDDHCIDPEAIDTKISPKTKAIIPVHFGGKACDMDEILRIARGHGIPVIEDAAHAFPCNYNGRPVGAIGDITCFSFYATKTLTTAEGGMAVTDNENWADRMRVMSLHGISKDAWKRYTAEGSWYYEIVAPGFKYNMTDVAAAMGVIQLRRADEMLQRRREIAQLYTKAFSSHQALELLDPGDLKAHAWHLFIIKLTPDLAQKRNSVIDALKSRGIGTSVHFIPLHIHPFYRETFDYAPEDIPVAFDLYQRSISLPIYSKLDESQVQRVIDAVLKSIASV